MTICGSLFIISIRQKNVSELIFTTKLLVIYVADVNTVLNIVSGYVQINLQTKHNYSFEYQIKYLDRQINFCETCRRVLQCRTFHRFRIIMEMLLLFIYLVFFSKPTRREIIQILPISIFRSTFILALFRAFLALFRAFLTLL